MVLAKQALASYEEVAGILGCSKKRVQQLYAKGKLPEPYQVLEVGPIWLKDDMIGFETESKAKYQRIKDLGVELWERDAGWDMRAVWSLHKTAERGELTREKLRETLEENGWYDYYRGLVRNPLV
ncbi:hypothetical protein ACFPOG_12585 [Paenibacillus aestuarii]|uniref:DNA-binding protein n=1 Tax=Paenibacillus aestuarii TaxID=516965 RepID=A0ABW0K980_9BACL